MSLATTANAGSLQLAQEAPRFLDAYSKPPSVFPFSLTLTSESPEQWLSMEKFLTACLRTGDDKSAHRCLEQLVARFGAQNERVMGLRGLYQETVAVGPHDLEKVLAEYDEILEKSPANTAVAKRRVTLLKNLSRPVAAIKCLVTLLEILPTDAEAWAELSDLYLSLGMFHQALHCLEEVLLIAPNAWNVHARIGEIHYLSTLSETGFPTSESFQSLQQALERFCRSVELCDGYLRGLCGLKIVTDKLLQVLSSGKPHHSRPHLATLEEVRVLNSRSGNAISALISSASDSTRPELIFAKALLETGLPMKTAH